MERNTGTPLGFALLLVFAFAFGWVVYDGHGGHDGLSLASFGSRSAQQSRTLEWPQQMPGPITDYVGDTIVANGLTVTSVDADEGFWVVKNGQRAWVQILTTNGRPPAESPQHVSVGQVWSLRGTVKTHDRNFPSTIYFCTGPEKDRSARELSAVPTHIAVAVEFLSPGYG